MLEFLLGQQSIFIPSLQFVWFVDSFEEGLMRPHLPPNYGFTAAEYTQIVHNAHDLQPFLTSLMIQHVVHMCMQAWISAHDVNIFENPPLDKI